MTREVPTSVEKSAGEKPLYSTLSIFRSAFHYIFKEQKMGKAGDGPYVRHDRLCQLIADITDIITGRKIQKDERGQEIVVEKMTSDELNELFLQISRQTRSESDSLIGHMVQAQQIHAAFQLGLSLGSLKEAINTERRRREKVEIQ